MTQNSKTVLIVEDSEVQALALKEILEEEGLNVLRAPDGQVGVSMTEQYMPDVVVLDLEMPEMNGFEACRRLKENEQTAGILIVMFTAHDEPDALIQGIDLGAIDFIPKDAFSSKVLLETLRQLNVLERETLP